MSTTEGKKAPHPILVFLNTKQTQLVGAVPKTFKAAMTWEHIVQTVALQLEKPGWAGEQLRKCAPQTVYNALLTILNLGLDIGMGEAYLIPYKGECTAMVSAAGKIALAYRSGMISRIVCQVVFESDDDFFIDLATGEVNHPMDLAKIRRIAGEGRGAMLACYARIWVKGTDEPITELMTLDQFQTIADAARKKNGDKLSPAYRDFPDEMFRRSCLNRALKRAPKSRDLAELLNRETQIEDADASNVPLVIDNDADNDAPALPDYGEPEDIEAELAKLREREKVVVETEPAPVKPKGFTDDLPTPEQLRAQIAELEKIVSGDVMKAARQSLGLPAYKPIPPDLPPDKLTALRDALKAKV